MRTSTNKLIFVTVLATFVASGCSNTNLLRNQVSVSSTAGVQFCTTPAQAINNNLKYIFVVDHSGSNQQNFLQLGPGVFVPDPTGGTDPLGNKRFAPLVDPTVNGFLTQIVDNPNTFYSSIGFSDAATTGLNWENAGVRTTLPQAVAYFNNQWKPNPTDGGGTNYLTTLNQVEAMIQQDVANAKSQVTTKGIVATDYVIFWVSDGAPFYNGVLQPEAQILAQVQAILALKGNDPDYIDSIILNTGFYHNVNTAANTPVPAQLASAQAANAQAAQYMQDMATAGSGVYIDFLNNIIDYTKFSVPVRNAKFVLRDLWIQNVSTVWWNGQLMADTDNDGLPDDIERQVGSDPNKYDSDGNGVGDGVEYYLYGKPCKDASCSPALAASFAVQCGPFLVAGTYKDTDGDYLNDCEETLLGSRLDNFDTNQDYVPDEFEWVNKVAFLAGTNNLLSDPQADGYTNYFKLKINKPVDFNYTGIHGIPDLTYQVAQISDNSSQTCFMLV